MATTRSNTYQVVRSRVVTVYEEVPVTAESKDVALERAEKIEDRHWIELGRESYQGHAPRYHFAKAVTGPDAKWVE